MTPTTSRVGLPRERTRAARQPRAVRREVGPITPKLSDALADHMNIRRGEVHEVVSFYSFLQVPVERSPRLHRTGLRLPRARVTCWRGRRARADGMRPRSTVPCLGPLRPRAGGDARRPARAAGRHTERTRRFDRPRALGRNARRLRAPRRARRSCVAPLTERIVEELRPAGLVGYGGAGFPTATQVGGRPPRARAAVRRRERRRGRARERSRTAT